MKRRLPFILLSATLALAGCGRQAATCDRSDAGAVMAAIVYANRPQTIVGPFAKLRTVPYRAADDLLRLNPGCCTIASQPAANDAAPGLLARLTRGGVRYAHLRFVEYYLDPAGRSRFHRRAATVALDRCGQVYGLRDGSLPLTDRTGAIHVSPAG